MYPQRLLQQVSKTPQVWYHFSVGNVNRHFAFYSCVDCTIASLWNIWQRVFIISTELNPIVGSINIRFLIFRILISNSIRYSPKIPALDPNRNNLVSEIEIKQNLFPEHRRTIECVSRYAKFYCLRFYSITTLDRVPNLFVKFGKLLSHVIMFEPLFRKINAAHFTL